MVTKILNPYTNKLSLAEIGQDIVLRMAYVHKEQDGTYTQLHDGVKCRDFLGDAVWATQQKIKINIYGFTFDGKKKPIDLDKMRLVLDFSSCEYNKKAFLNNFDIVHRIEERHKLPKTRIYSVKDNKNKYILEASKFWQKSVFNVSLYTFLLKCMCYEYINLANWFAEIKPRNNNEGRYASQVSKIWDFYIKNLKQINRGAFNATGNETLLEPMQISQCHNYCGFVSMRFFEGKKDTFMNRRLNKLWKGYTNANSAQ